MKWSNVIGQEEVKTRLRELVRDGHIPHAIMLSGETGYGTLALAMAFASTLLCRFSATKKKVLQWEVSSQKKRLTIHHKNPQRHAAVVRSATCYGSGNTPTSTIPFLP